MKKPLIALLSISLLLAVGCGPEESESQNQNQNQNQNQSPNSSLAADYEIFLRALLEASRAYEADLLCGCNYDIIGYDSAEECEEEYTFTTAALDEAANCIVDVIASYEVEAPEHVVGYIACAANTGDAFDACKAILTDAGDICDEAVNDAFGDCMDDASSDLDACEDDLTEAELDELDAWGEPFEDDLDECFAIIYPEPEVGE